MRNLLVIVTLIGVSLVSETPNQSSVAAQSPTLKLAVMIVVDQMRADFVDRFRGEWAGGLKRMVTEGAWFSRAAYPYLATLTCSGHATVATGAYPRTHGIIQNAWWDRDSGKQVACTQDDQAAAVSYDAPIAGTGDSARRLLVSTLADQLRLARGAHVVSLSLKARSAIMLAGHGGEAVTWLSDALDRWETSSAFAAAALPQIQTFVAAHAIDADFSAIWTPLLPPGRYRETDDGAGETPPRGWTRTFPHPLGADSPRPDAAYRVRWERSPFADAYLGAFAADLVRSFRLGQHDGTDVLAVSFSTPDLIGHAFGPRSLEVHDTYARLDRTIGMLIDRLDVLVGRSNYVIGLTADHGVTPIPEQLQSEGKDGGRLSSAAIAALIEEQSAKLAGDGAYVARVNTNDIYFAPGMYARLTQSPPAMDAVIKALTASPGIDRVFRSEDLAGGAFSSDRLLRAAALSYLAGRSGDLIIAPKAGWMFAAVGTTHGSASADDQRVPILLLGRGVRKGEFRQPASPADIAPTLAALSGVALPQAEGRVLTEALLESPGSNKP
jgi:predicted AlkP superfamily pyrophosphatase or phosphodiesterase